MTMKTRSPGTSRRNGMTTLKNGGLKTNGGHQGHQTPGLRKFFYMRAHEGVYAKHCSDVPHDPRLCGFTLRGQRRPT